MELWIRKITPIGKSKYRIELDGQLPFVLYKGELFQLGLEEETVLSEEIYRKIHDEILAKRAKLRAMHLLEKSDRTEAEIRKKLAEGEYPQDLIDAAVAYLYSYHYLDDARYVRNYIHVYGASKSLAELRRTLASKGIEKGLFDQILEELREENASAVDGMAATGLRSEEDKILCVLSKKHFTWADADEKEKARIYRHLAGKGYRSEDILRCMKLT